MSTEVPQRSICWVHNAFLPVQGRGRKRKGREREREEERAREDRRGRMSRE